MNKRQETRSKKITKAGLFIQMKFDFDFSASQGLKNRRKSPGLPKLENLQETLPTKSTSPC